MSSHTTTVGGRSASPTAAGMVANVPRPVKRWKPHGHRIRDAVKRLGRCGFYGLKTIPRGDFAHYSENGWAAPKCGQPGSDVCAFYLVEANLVTTALAAVAAALATLVVVLVALLVARRRLALAMAQLNE